ncbi:MAG: hypothetical protein WCK32_00505 [Chlorobiaceae bacterium]
MHDTTSELRPNQTEIAFLNLAYNSFYDIFDEVMDDSFWDKDAWYRFSRVTTGFAIYAEVLNYEPIKWSIEHIRRSRPPMEAEIGSELFKFIRNVLSHFPFFLAWDEVWISKSLVNWYKKGQSIDKFLNTYAGKPPVKYRFWEASKKRMTYLSITFPTYYDGDTKVCLKDLVNEKDGVRFCFILMKQIMNTQVDNEVEKIQTTV